MLQYEDELGFWVSGQDVREAIANLLRQTQELDTDMQLAVRDGKLPPEEYGKWEEARDKVLAWVDEVTASFMDWKIGVTSVQTLGKAERLQAVLKGFANRLASYGTPPRAVLDPLSEESKGTGGIKLDLGGGLGVAALALGALFLFSRR